MNPRTHEPGTGNWEPENLSYSHMSHAPRPPTDLMLPALQPILWLTPADTGLSRCC